MENRCLAAAFGECRGAMVRPVARVAAVHDITGVGRCGLSVAIPVLSALGHQACPLPTAVLSTHPAGFEGQHAHVLSADVSPVLAHWAREAICFDAVYTGYMGDVAQVQAVLAVRMQTGMLLVDPVVGDHGRLYSIVDAPMVEAMKALAASADVITPNLTEAYALLGRDYTDKGHSREAAAELAAALGARYGAACVVTGVPSDDGRMMNVLHMPGEAQAAYAVYDAAPVSYPGTGDVFASLLLGVYLHTKDMEQAFRTASCVTTEIVVYTHGQNTPPREGVLVEAFCPQMLAQCGIAEA